jgi:hypothetical protein
VTVSADQLVSQPRSGARRGAARGSAVIPENPRRRPPVYTPPAAPRRRRPGPLPADASPAPQPVPDDSSLSRRAVAERRAAREAETQQLPAQADDEGQADEDQEQATTPPARGQRVIGGPSGAILAMFLYPMGFALLKGGPDRMWGWIKAKFFNEPYSAAAGPAPGAGAGSGRNPVPRIHAPSPTIGAR